MIRPGHLNANPESKILSKSMKLFLLYFRHVYRDIQFYFMWLIGFVHSAERTYKGPEKCSSQVKKHSDVVLRF
jgi:hypothetical protein